jgi:hypothetical protein
VWDVALSGLVFWFLPAEACVRAVFSAAGTDRLVDSVKEPLEFLLPVPRQTLADDSSCEHIQCGEQGGRSFRS